MENTTVSAMVKMSLEEIGKADSECYGFYDWFGSTKSLKGKAKRLMGFLRNIVKANEHGKLFDPDKCEAFFKENCPCYGDGKLYLSVSIETMDGKVLFWASPRNTYGKAELCFEGHGFDSNSEGLSYKGTRELANFFKNPENKVYEDSVYTRKSK